MKVALIKGVDKVCSALQRRAQRVRQDANASVIVGYTAAYALYVHENLEARHAAGTQAKFLEQPARELRRELQKIIRAADSIRDGLLLAGLRLQRESQKIVPVDTGNLRASAFTREE